MTSPVLLAAALSALVFLALVLLMRRRRLRARAAALESKIRRRFAGGLGAELERQFDQGFITTPALTQFAALHHPLFLEAESLREAFERSRMELPEALSDFVRDCRTLKKEAQKHNEAVLESLLEAHRDFFDHALPHPLSLEQRIAILAETEESTLVASGAGCGKTSAIVGKVRFLVEVKGVPPERILLISYTRKAAEELTRRTGVHGMRGQTFHSLALEIIGRATEQKPTIEGSPEALFERIFHELLEEPSFRRSVLDYFAACAGEAGKRPVLPDELERLPTEEKSGRIRALFPDMDGRSIWVRSREEQRLCLFLSTLGVTFRYEEPYEYPVADAAHVQYRPDFSIHFERFGQPRRLYFEHFGINAEGRVAPWFAKRGESPEDATQRYLDGIAWKKALHRRMGTRLIFTTSADFHEGDVREKLRRLLKAEGVPLRNEADEGLGRVIPERSAKERAFIRLIVTFATLAKANRQPLPTLLARAKKKGDTRSARIIEEVFGPICRRYEEELRQSGRIDFTDAILRATECCRAKPPEAWDAIVVDEFQDISADRCEFLKALRAGSPPARLFCVGDDWQSIFRFAGSDVGIFAHFSDHFGPAALHRLESTHRFGEPLAGHATRFVTKNPAQVKKRLLPARSGLETWLTFLRYENETRCQRLEAVVDSIPMGKSILFLGRYSFDADFLENHFLRVREGERVFYRVAGRKIEFLTVHRAKGLEADFVVILQCSGGLYGFPSQVADDRVLDAVLPGGEAFPCAEERRLFYVAITRAKEKTLVLYDVEHPSPFVKEFIRPPEAPPAQAAPSRPGSSCPNAGKRWTPGAEALLLNLHREGKSVPEIARKMGRTQRAIAMRLEKLHGGGFLAHPEDIA